MYNDYPGVSDSYDGSMSIDEAELDAAVARVRETQAVLRELAAEGDGFTVLGRYFPTIDDARMQRGITIDRRTRDLARFTAHVAALTIELCRDEAA